MDTLHLHDLKELAGVKGTGVVSIYLPTVGVGPEEAQDVVRLDELMHQADQLLRPAGSTETPAAITAIGRLVKKAEFWKQRSQGLAIFAWGNEVKAWRLPHSFAPAVVVGSCVHVKPLLPTVDRGHWFHLLTLSQNHSHLFKVSRSRIESLDLPGFPESMAQALNIDVTDRPSQVHEGMRGGAGKQGAVFHGQGGTRDALKSDLSSYFHLIDRAVRPVLNGHNAPLVLGGVEYLMPLFREACSYPHLVEQHLEGNFDRESTRELHARSWALMEPVFDRARCEALERVAALTGTGKGAAEISQVVSGAVQGRVQVLFVDPAQALTGQFDPQTNRVSVEAGAKPGNADLINLAVAATLQQGGEVYTASQDQLPDRSCVAAIFRY